MNYCRKCQSDYEKPGTCNCFAPSQTFAPPTYVPTYIPWPQPTYIPYVPPFPMGGGGGGVGIEGGFTITTGQGLVPDSGYASGGRS